MMTEQHFRSVGAVMALVISYFVSTSSGISEMTQLACIWAMSAVIGGFFGQRFYVWKRR